MQKIKMVLVVGLRANAKDKMQKIKMVLVGLRASVGPHRPLLSESSSGSRLSQWKCVCLTKKSDTEKGLHKSRDSMGGREQCVFREL